MRRRCAVGGGWGAGCGCPVWKVRDHGWSKGRRYGDAEMLRFPK